MTKTGFDITNDDTDMRFYPLLAEIFVDDIIFGGKDSLCKYFANEMNKEFEISMFGGIKFFFGLQVN